MPSRAPSDCSLLTLARGDEGRAGEDGETRRGQVLGFDRGEARLLGEGDQRGEPLPDARIAHNGMKQPAAIQRRVCWQTTGHATIT